MAEILFTARTSYPDTIIPGEDNRLSLEVRRDGDIVTPSSSGNFQLLGPDGTVIKAVFPTIEADGSLLVALSEADPLITALEVGELYQTRWTPVLPGTGGGNRTFRREAVVSPLRLYPPAGEIDLVEGNYPDLVEQLGSFGTTLQPFLDQAWGWVLRQLFKVGRWPDLLVSTHDAFEVHRERAWYQIFRFLFRRTGGRDNRFEQLYEDHRAGYKREWIEFSGRWDNDADGLAEDLDREAASHVVHPNAAPRRRLRRDARW